MFEKKKKEYSEISETGLNINSDYFKILHKEFKSLFVEKNNDDLNNNDLNNNVSIETNNINVEQKLNIKLSNLPNNKIELNNQDIFYIGLFSRYITNK